MPLGKSLEEYSCNELQDLLKIVGVRPHILSRGRIDGYRLVRLSDAQIQDLQVTPLERWKLQIVRSSFTVFKVFTRGLNAGGSCPIAVICNMLRSTFGYEVTVVEEVRQGLLSHTESVRTPAGARLVTFDQWAQLFQWISSRLDLQTPAQLQQRMGSHLNCKFQTCRAPLQAKNRSMQSVPCMPLHHATVTAPSFSLMPELFRDITRESDSLATSPLQEQTALNQAANVTPSSSRSRSRSNEVMASRLPTWPPRQTASSAMESTRSVPTGAISSDWLINAEQRQTVPQHTRRSYGPSPLMVAHSTVQNIARGQWGASRLAPQRIRGRGAAEEFRDGGAVPRSADVEVRDRSFTPPRRTLAAERRTQGTQVLSNERVGGSVTAGRSNGSVQTRLPALLSLMQAGSELVTMRSRGVMQTLAAQSQNGSGMRQALEQPLSRIP